VFLFPSLSKAESSFISTFDTIFPSKSLLVAFSNVLILLFQPVFTFISPFTSISFTVFTSKPVQVSSYACLSIAKEFFASLAISLFVSKMRFAAFSVAKTLIFRPIFVFILQFISIEAIFAISKVIFIVKVTSSGSFILFFLFISRYFFRSISVSLFITFFYSFLTTIFSVFIFIIFTSLSFTFTSLPFLPFDILFIFVSIFIFTSQWL